MNLPAYTDVVADGPGEVFDINTFRARFAGDADTERSSGPQA
jgi:hypothetical protein